MALAVFFPSQTLAAQALAAQTGARFCAAASLLGRAHARNAREPAVVPTIYDARSLSLSSLSGGSAPSALLIRLDAILAVDDR